MTPTTENKINTLIQPNMSQPQFVLVPQPAYQPQVAFTPRPPNTHNLSKGFYRESHKISVKTLAKMQIVSSLLCVIFQIINTSLYHGNRNETAFPGDWSDLAFEDGFIAGGIWIGSCNLLTGIIGIIAVKIKSGCMIFPFLVCNIVQCLLTTPVLIVLTFLSLVKLRNCPSSYGYRYRGLCNEDLKEASIAFSSLMLILSIAQFIMAIICSAYGCRATCCRPSNAPTQVAYIPQGYVMNSATQSMMASPATGIQYPVGSSAPMAQFVSGQNPADHVGASQSQAPVAPNDMKPPSYTKADEHYEPMA